MANRFYNYIVTLVAGTLAKAEDVGPSNFGSIETGMTAIEGELDQAIRITNSPGTTTIALNAAARALKLLSFDVNGDLVTTTTVGSNKGNHAAAAGTAYVINDIVKDSTGSLGLNNIYIANTAHTSTGTLSTDTANWDLLLDAASAAASAAAALVSELAAAATYDLFDDRVLGTFTTAAEPTLDNDGNALLTGALYWNTTLSKWKTWNGAAWTILGSAAVDVSIADAGGYYSSAEVEAALQEVWVRAIAFYESPPLTGGTTTAYTATLGITAYTTGTVYKVRINAANTAASVSMNFDGVGSRFVRVLVGGAAFSLKVGELATNHIAEVYYDGSQFLLLNPAIVTSVFTATLVPGSGTITLTATLDSLSITLHRDVAHVQGTITVSSVSSPSGTLLLSGFSHSSASISEDGDVIRTTVHYLNLASAATLGLTGKMLGSSTGMSILDKTALGESTSTAGFIGAGTTLAVNFTYRVR